MNEITFFCCRSFFWNSIFIQHVIQDPLPSARGCFRMHERASSKNCGSLVQPIREHNAGSSVKESGRCGRHDLLRRKIVKVEQDRARSEIRTVSERFIMKVERAVEDGFKIESQYDQGGF
jgi:hypothetical protein